jgi:hypothetical protein
VHGSFHPLLQHAPLNQSGILAFLSQGLIPQNLLLLVAETILIVFGKDSHVAILCIRYLIEAGCLFSHRQQWVVIIQV